MVAVGGKLYGEIIAQQSQIVVYAVGLLLGHDIYLVESAVPTWMIMICYAMWWNVCAEDAPAAACSSAPAIWFGSLGEEEKGERKVK